MSRPQQENAGPLASIQDQIARKEIGKLWSSVNTMRGQTGTEPYATKAELTALERKLLSREKEVVKVAEGGSSVSGGGGGGLDLRPLDNLWTGRNTYSRLAAPDSPAVRIESMANGSTMATPNATSILLGSGYSALFDVRRTTKANEPLIVGGHAAAYVQHRVGDESHTGAVHIGLRVQTESGQRAAVGVLNESVAGMFGINNRGANANATGLYVDTYHNSTDQGGLSFTTGVSAIMHRTATSGHTVGFNAIARAAASSWGFLASGVGGFHAAFSAGNYLGPLTCDYGLDLSHATCAKAAVMVPAGKKIVMNAPSESTAIQFNMAQQSIDCTFPNGKFVRFAPDASIHGSVLWLTNDVNANGGAFFGGTVSANGGLVTNGDVQAAGGVAMLGSLHLVNANTNSPPGVAAAGYVAIVVQNSTAWVPIYR